MESLKLKIEELYKDGAIGFYTYYHFLLNYHQYVGSKTFPYEILLDYMRTHEIDHRRFISLYIETYKLCPQIKRYVDIESLGSIGHKKPLGTLGWG